jgi:ABC-type nitrate/sulfonate/bicarbonate transport system substrate-binding protein
MHASSVSGEKLRRDGITRQVGGGSVSEQLGWSLNRRQFLKTVGVAGGVLVVPSSMLAACGDGGEAADGELALVRYQLDWLKNSQFSGFYIADSKGYYANEGVQVRLLPGADVASHEAVVAGGGAEMGTSSFLSRIVDAVNAGSDLVVVGAGLQQSPIGLMSMADNPIQSAEDILGKKIGLQEGSTSEIKLILELNGLDPEDWTEVPVGFDPSPLLEGQVDAYYAYLTSQPLIFESQGLHEGEDFVVVSFQDLGWYQYGMLAITKRSYLEENRDDVVGFMRATIMGWEETVQDPDAGIRLTMDEYGKDLGLDEETERQSLQAQLPLMQSDLTNEKGLYWMDLELLAGPMYEALSKGGRDQLPEPDSLVDLSVLEEAYGGKTSLLSD